MFMQAFGFVRMISREQVKGLSETELTVEIFTRVSISIINISVAPPGKLRCPTLELAP